MKDKMMKMMGEKKKLSPIEQKAKMGVLEQLKKDMQDMMGEKVAGLKKVTVAAPDQEGLEEGLEKAKDIVEGAEEGMGEMDHEGEEGESEEEKGSLFAGHESLADDAKGDMAPGEESEEELDSKIQELLKKKASLKK